MMTATKTTLLAFLGPLGKPPRLRLAEPGVDGPDWRFPLAPPRGLLERVRWLLLLVCLAFATLAGLVAVALGHDSPEFRFGGVAALAALCAWWILGYRRGSLPVAGGVLEAAAIVTLVVAVEEPMRVMHFVFVGLFFGSLYGSARSVAARATAYAAALVLGVWLAPSAVTPPIASLWFAMQLLALAAGAGVMHVIAVILDEQERINARMTETLRQSEARFRSLVQNASDVITVLNPRGTIAYESPPVERVLGYKTDRRVGTNGLRYVHPEDRARVRELFMEMQQEPGGFRCVEVRLRSADGTFRWAEVTFTNLIADPSIAGIVANHRDITERKALEEELAHQAFHDPLTGLANRALFKDRLKYLLARAQRHQEPLAVLFIDLDDFKLVNDTLGHGVGDQLLVGVGERLQGSSEPWTWPLVWAATSSGSSWPTSRPAKTSPSWRTASWKR